ncbi:hypothetical protein CEXT_679401 [Caerostris extrusa]|uniref:Uncharacterized protein n=1 Tax=Caerostris extrusa TaxID=172846 RepID=A0AAV4SNZ1_CAEEX|nr:hypothetical protein CEXT_679401 [Caerostris extrusa]
MKHGRRDFMQRTLRYPLPIQSFPYTPFHLLLQEEGSTAVLSGTRKSIASSPFSSPNSTGKEGLELE